MLPVSDGEARLKELTNRRKPLAEQFEKNPTAIHLALEIKVVDDEIAEVTRQVRDSRKIRK